MGSGKRRYRRRQKYVPKEKKLTMPKFEKKEVSEEDKKNFFKMIKELKDKKLN